MIDIDTFIEVLEKSLERNGEKPLTNKWLLNLLKTTQKRQEYYDQIDSLPCDNFEFWKD
jgi:hypothetical protein